MVDFILNAQVRSDLGKGASRRLRRANQFVPAVVYGGEKGAQSISVEKTAFYKAIEDESFFSSVIKLVIDGSEEQVVVRDLQRHPFKPLLTHGGWTILAFVVAGGALYTAGAVVYGLKRPNPSPRWFGFHEIFHALTVLAFISHFVAATLALFGPIANS